MMPREAQVASAAFRTGQLRFFSGLIGVKWGPSKALTSLGMEVFASARKSQILSSRNNNREDIDFCFLFAFVFLCLRMYVVAKKAWIQKVVQIYFPLIA